MKRDTTHLITNQEEASNFLRGAIVWRGSVTPRIMPMLLLLCLYPLGLVALDHYWQPLPTLDVTPFEYTGVVLGMVLVFRTNAGYDRWGEARKSWGGIISHSRNLIIGALQYGPSDPVWREAFVKWTIVFSFATKESLRSSHNFVNLTDMLSKQELEELSSALHMPLFVASKIAALLQNTRSNYQNTNGAVLDSFESTILEGQRILLVDAMGACERILRTPMPLVYAVKTRRFIFMFLLLLPFSLLERSGFYTIGIFFLVAYPLLSLDRIGIELQKPFDKKSLSHLPLDALCETIKLQGLNLWEHDKCPKTNA